MNFSKVKLQMIKEKDFNCNADKIHTTTDIVELINDIEELDKLAEETTILICLNTKNQIVSYSEIAKGGLNTCNIDLKSIFKMVLLSNATKFILVHNHPSGETTPSFFDIHLTKEIEKASKIMRIEFLDHIIVGTASNFCSCFKYLKDNKEV